MRRVIGGGVRSPWQLGNLRPSTLAGWALVVTLFAYGCVNRDVIGVTVGTVTVSPSGTTLVTGDTLRFGGAVTDVEDRALRRAVVFWSTATPDVVTVDSAGLVLAVGPGEGTVRAEFSGVTGTATVTVIAAPDVTVEPDSAVLVGEAGAADPVPTTLRVSNAGEGGLTGLAVEVLYPTGAPSGWLTADLAATTDPTDLVLSATTSALPVGRFEATARVSSPDDRDDPFDLPVLLVLTGLTVSETGAGSEVSEAGGTDSVTVVLDAAPDTTVVLSVSSSLPSEITVSSDTLVFTPGDWDSPQVIVLTGVDEVVRDGDRSVDITISVVDSLSDDGYDPIADQAITAINTDDDVGSFTVDAPPVLSLSEDGGTDDFTVVLDAQPLDTIVFQISAGDTTEVALSPAVLTFAPADWSLPQTVSLQGRDDDLIDGVQTSQVYVAIDSARSDPAFLELGLDSVTVSTTDNDAAGVSVSVTAPPSPLVDSTSVSEAGTTDSIVVVLDAQPTTNVVFTVTPSDAGEVAVSAPALTFTPASWSTPQVITVTGVDDLAIDGDQVTQVTVAVDVGASDDDFDAIGPIAIDVTTTDDDQAGIVIVESDGATVTDEAGAAPDQFTVALGAQPPGQVVIDVVSSDVSEVTLSPARLTFPSADWDVPQVVTVVGVDERFDDDDRLVPVVLTVDTAATIADYDLLPPDTVVVTNVDDDVAGFTLTQTNGGSLVTEGGSQDTIAVVLDARPMVDVVLTLLSSDPSEVVVALPTLTFTTDDWDTAQDIVVTGVDDGEADGNQFSLIAVGVSAALSDSTFTNVGDQTVLVTTTNDDAVEITVAPTGPLLTNESGSTAAFSVVLGSVPSADVTITAVSDTPTEGVATPGSITFTTGDWDTPQFITVTGQDDAIDDGDRDYTIVTTVSSADPNYASVDPADVTARNSDNESPPALSVDDVSVAEGDAGTTTLAFTVTQSLGSAQPVTVGYATADVSATAGSDYVSASGILTFVPGAPLTQTISVSVTGDALDEGASETLNLLLSGATNATISDATGVGTIVDDDGAPSFTISDVTVVEGAADAVFTVTQSAASGQTTTVDYATADGSATAGADYTATSGTLTFVPGGPLSQIVTVPVTADLLDEGASEVFTVELSGATNASILDPSGTGTITDDDSSPSLSIADVTVIEGDAGTVSALFVVTQSAASGLPVSVSYATADGTATAGSDYTATTGTVVFTPGGSLTQSIEVIVSGDLFDDGVSETFTVGLSGPVNATITDAVGLGTITDDDDEPTLSIGDAAVTEGNGGTVNAQFTVTQSAPSGQIVTVDYATSDASATAGADYVGVPATTLTFLPGAPLTQTVTIVVNGDLLDEGAAESFLVGLSNQTNASILDGSGTGTITDDDSPPSMSIDDVTLVEGNAGSVNAALVVTLTAPSGLPIDVSYTTVDGSALAGADYTATVGTLSFTPGGPLSQSILVPVTGDLIDEGVAEAFTVALSSPNNATITDGNGTVTVTDDDSPPSLSIDDINVTEGDAGTVNAVFTITQSAPSGLVVGVDFASADGTATAPTDYGSATGSVTFAPGGPLTRTVTVVVNGDVIAEGPETFSVDLTNPTNASIADPSGVATIDDDDAAPTLSIADVTVAEGDAGTVSALFAVTLSGPSSQTVSVDWATANGTALAGSDYVGTSGTVSFAPGGPLTQSVSVSVTGDLLDEGLSEAFTVELTNPVGASILDGSGTGTITDDDDPPSLSINDVSLTEGDAGPVNAVFTVSLSVASSQTVTVDYATADGTATVAADPDPDYVATSGTLTFVPGGPLTQTITVQVLGDLTEEGVAETFAVGLSNAVNAGITDGSGQGTIIDDEGTPTIFFDGVTVTEGDAGTVDAAFTVSLSTATNQTVTVDYTTIDGTASAGADYVGLAGTLTFLQGGPLTQTVTVLVNGDVIDEGTSESFTLELTNPTNAAILDPSEAGIITDDDAATLAVGDATVTEGDAGTVDAQFVVSMSVASSQVVTVDFQSADGSATAGSDYGAVAGTLTFLPGAPLSQIVTVAVNGDLIDEGAAESFTLNLSNAANAGIVDGSGAGTIVDDDDPPVLTIDDVTVLEGDAGTVNAQFTVTQSRASNQTVTVGFATANGTAVEGADYVATSGVLTFLPGGSLTQTVTVLVNGDVIDEGTGETFAVGLSNATNATIGDPTGVGTITDDDDAPSLSIGDVTVVEGDAGAVGATFVVTLSAASGQTVNVDYATADGTASGGSDYVTTSGTLTFVPGGALTETVTVFVSADVLDEGASEDFTVGLTNPVNATILDGSGAGTITDDDDPPSLAIGDVTVTEGDGGTVDAVFTVTQSAASGLDVTVDYTSVDGTATVAESDYALATGTLTFTAGGPLTQTLTVVVSGDLIDEGVSEAFDVQLSNPTNASISDATGTGTITDDDSPATLSIDDVTVTEGDAGTVDAVFTVSRSAESSLTITVAYATADGTAAAGLDYTATSGVLTFLPGGPATQTVTVPVIGDGLDEGISETFTVGLSNAINATIADPSGAGTVIDDDGAPTLSIDDVTVTEGNAGSVTAAFTVTLSENSGQTIGVQYATTDGTASAGLDFVGATGSVSFAPGGPLTQTVNIVVTGDLIDEGVSESFTVDLNTPVNAVILDGSGAGTITDDDDATLSINDVTLAEGNSGTVDAVFTVSKLIPSSQTVTVDFATANLTAVAPSDYVATTGTLTFLAGGPLTQTITVAVNGDLTPEGTSETFTVGLTNATNATIVNPLGLGTIVDDDGQPTLFADPVTVIEGDAGTVDADFTVTLSAPSAQPVDVDYATADVTASAGTDYVSTSGTLTFTPGGPLSQTVTVTVNGDLIDEGLSETFNFNLSNAVNAAILDPSQVGTITDDETAALSIDDVTVTEGDAGTVNALFTVTKSLASGQAVTVDYATADGTALAGADYAATSGTLTFNTGGALTQTITVAVAGDLLDEGAAETFAVNLSNATSATILDASGVGTITDDDTAPSLSVNDVSVTEGDAGSTTATFTVTQSAASSQTVNVSYATVDATANSGADYSGTSGVLTFLPGGSLTQIVSVTVFGDVLDEGVSETFTIELSTPVNATIADGSGLGTITDDDAPPTLSIGDATVLEGDLGTVTALFTVTQSGASGQTVTVDYATADGTATGGPDYTSASGTLTFLPGGSLTQTVSIIVSGDLLDEGIAESFSVALSSPTNAAIVDGTGDGTITDDDAAPTLAIADVTLTEGDAGTVAALFTVTQSAASGQTVSVSYATADGTASAGLDYAGAAGTLTFLPGGALSQTISVDVNGDLLDEGSAETFTVVLSSPSNATIADGVGAGTIIDDDGAPELSIGDVTVLEGDGGTVNAQFVVTLSAASGLPVGVGYTTVDGTATAASDYTGVLNSLTFLPGDALTQNVTVVVNGDVLDEGDSETFTVVLSGATNASIVDASGTGTITDDDGSQVFSIGDATVVEGNAGTVNAVFTVTLDAPSGLTTEVSYATADGTATLADSDYVNTVGTLTFVPGGGVSQTVTVPVNGDVLDEGVSETFTVNLSSPVNATIGTATGTGTITDDDDAPTLSIDDVSVTEGNAGTTEALFTVTLSAASGQSVTADYATADGTATVADSDYSATSGTLTFAPGGPLTQTVSVQVTGDLVDEIATETFAVNLTNEVNATLADASGTGTIVDDDGAPTIFTNDVTVTEGDAGSVDAIFTVTMSSPSSQNVTVDYATADGTATAGSDYVGDSNTLTFLPGGPLTQTVTISVTGDVVDEGSAETFSFGLSNATNATITDPSETGTITDDDDAVLSVDDVAVVEGDAGSVDLIFTVTKSLQSEQIASVLYATADGTALAGADYTAASGALIFLPGGGLTQPVTVSVTGDGIDEGAAEDFTLDLSSAVAAAIGDGTGIGTIIDDDGPPSLTIDDVTVTEGDAGTVNAVFTVTQSVQSGQATSVDWATADGTATGGSDFLAASGTVNFTPGGSLTQTVSVQINGDLLDEGLAEAFTVELTSPTNSVIADGSGAGTITDDDDPPSVSIDDVTVTEGDAGTVNAVFTVTQSVQSGLPTSIDFTTVDVTATAGADYAAQTGTVNFTPGGSLTQTVTIVVNGDLIDEGVSETFTVDIISSVDVTLGDASGLGTITDDDTATLSVDDVTVLEGDAGTTTALFTVTQSVASSLDVTVDFQTTDGTATVAGGDYVSALVPLTFTAGGSLTQTVGVTVNGDVIDEGASETFNVTLLNPVNATITDGTGVGTITDDDNATLSIDDVTVTEGDVGTVTAVFTVTKSLVNSEVVTVDFNTADVTATVAGLDYLAASGQLSFPAGVATSQTINVTVTGDEVDEGISETFEVGLSNPTNATVAVAPGTGTITDDDDAGITVTPTTGLQTTEVGGTAQFTVVLDSEPTADVTIGVASSDGGEGDVTDPAGGSLVFTSANWETPQTVTVTGDNDPFADGDIAYSIVTAAATSPDPIYNGLNPDDVSVTNLDNEVAGFTLTEVGGNTVTNESGQLQQVRVVLDEQPETDVVITVTAVDPGEVSVNNLAQVEVTFTTGNWDTFQVISVRGVPDGIDDGDTITDIVFSVDDAQSADPFDALADQAVPVTNEDIDP